MLFQGPGDDIYVVDTCAITDLELENRGVLPGLDSDARDSIWAGIVRLIREGRMVTVQQSRAEIDRHCPTAMRKLRPYKDKFFLTNTPELYAMVTEVFKVWPHQARKSANLPPNREPADPYLIAIAYLRGYVVVTDERHKRDRTPNNKSGLMIPDICERMKPVVRCYSLAELIEVEQL